MSNTLVLFNKIFLTNKKHITVLKRHEFLELKESGEYEINWAYDGKHSIITKKKPGKTEREAVLVTASK